MSDLLVAIIVCSILIISTLMCVIILFHHENKKKEIVLKSIANIYHSMHVIDLINNTVHSYNMTETLKKYVNRSTDAANLMVHVIKSTIEKEYLQYALEFTDLTTLPDRLMEKNTISAEFVNKDKGWIRGRFIVIERSEKGAPTSVVFATIIIEEEKRKEEGLIRISNTDELTGLKNRRAYDKLLVDYEGNKEDVTVISMDINRLKATNDTLGHSAGDELIQAAADYMKKAFSEYGEIFRTGGDEFVALLQLDDEAFKAVLEKFNKTVSEWKGQLVQSMTISSGSAKRSDYPEKSMEDLIKIADEQMYSMKHQFYIDSGLDRRHR